MELNSFWNGFSIALIVLSILACWWLLHWTKGISDREEDEDIHDTGHVWDEDIRELNNPLPRWWLNMFNITIVFALVYLALYPGLGNLAGVLGWTQEKQHAEEVAQAEEATASVFAAYNAMPLEELIRNPAAMETGRRLWGQNCAMCHGSDLRGATGFPNLVDDAWQWGIMTLSGAWHKLRTDPILKFMIVALSFYGMSTFEGPMMSIKTVNALSHYTDWTIGHVHSGALGWVAMMTIGSLYCMIPRLVGKKEMHSIPAIDLHFWTSTIGVVLYIASMWIAGVMQGLMWRAFNDDGTLTYTFIESIAATKPYYVIRLLGGTVFFVGMLIMAWNVWKTMAGAKPVEVEAAEPAYWGSEAEGAKA